MNKYALILLLLILSSTAFGQACRSYEKGLRDNLKEIFEKINKGEAIRDKNGNMIRPRTVDDFLSLLPKELTTDMITMSSSQSIQSGTVENPRVILKSPNSEITLSFNTDPTLSGGDHVEALVFDAENAKYELYEVDFSATENKKQKPEDREFFEKEAVNKKAEVHKDSTKCIACHGDPIRPIWQPYRFWTGQTPFVEDTLVKDSKETEWYMNYMENIKTQKPRWRHLTPPFTKEQAQAAIDSQGQFTIPNQKARAKEFRSTDGSGNDLANQFLDQNACMVMNNLSKRDDWNQIKYLVAGTLNGCRPPQNFVPPAIAEEAIAYNQRRGIGLDQNGKFSLDALTQDTRKRLDQSTVYKADAHKAHLRKHMTEEEVTREFDMRRGIGFGFRNFETNESVIANLRFMLQPLGVDINRWSMDNDPTSFAHGQVFDNYVKQPITTALLRESNYDCGELARKSQAAMVSHKSINDPMKLVNECDYEKINDVEYINSFMKVGKQLLAQRVSTTFDQVGCMYCHDKMGTKGNIYTDNRPEMSLADPEKMEALFKQRPALMEALQDRIARPPEAPGHMPPYGGSLSTEQIGEIKAYFELLRKEPK